MQLLIALSVFPAYLVGSFFIRHDPGPPEPQKEIRRSIYFGVLSVVAALALGTLLSYSTTGYVAAEISQIARESSLPFVLFIFVFAGIEELTKFVPIALYIRKKSFFNEHTDGIIYFAIVGLTFGAIENFVYGVAAGDIGASLILMRFVIALFFHGALTSLVGYFYARAHVRQQGFGVPVLVLLAAIVLHTIYNVSAFSIEENLNLIFVAAGVAIVVNGLMFWLYFIATKNDAVHGLLEQHSVSQD